MAMSKEQRYEVNGKGELVVGFPVCPKERKKLVEQLFSRFGWNYELLEEITQAHYHIKVSNENLGKSYKFHLFHGTVRIEDPERNRAEKKIQLGGLDPREVKEEMSIILGFYIYENDDINDATIVAWPIEEEKNYPNNPSLRVNMKSDILPAKNTGMYVDKTSGKKIVAFQPDFIYYYLENYKSLHGYDFVEHLDADENGGNEMPANDTEETCTFDTNKSGSKNLVVYGTPGCGKSYYVENDLLKTLGVAKENRIRTTFYMDYTNTDFVGQILPKLHDEGDKHIVTYEFNPGPFALALRMALECPDESVALIIEELNRGNAPSIFGDVFQLLDRDETGKSEYAITNVNLQDYLNKIFAGQYSFEYIKIPSNLYIVATMNTSDQNVFTLDTAFKRRWQFEKMRNTFTAEHKYKDYFIPGMDSVTWETLVNAINAFIINNPDDMNAEDKQLGVYFIKKDNLCATQEDCGKEQKKKEFAYKLFEYLWDDVAKFNHEEWFGTDIKTLEQLIDRFMEYGKQVLENVFPKE